MDWVFGDFQSLKPNPDEHRIQPIETSHLADKQYKTQCNTFRGGAAFCALGYGREVRVGAAYKF